MADAAAGAVEVQVQVQMADGLAVLEGMEVQRWVCAALVAAGADTTAEITVRLVDEAEGAQLNRHYRHGSGATNVLSFPSPLLPPVPGMTLPLGDVVICLPVVHRESLAQHKPVLAHLAHLVVHGVLHLAGHDHDGDAHAATMEALETAVLGHLGFDDPWTPQDGPPRRTDDDDE